MYKNAIERCLKNVQIFTMQNVYVVALNVKNKVQIQNNFND